MYQYRCVTYSTVFIPNLIRILIHTRYCPVLDCTVFVSDLYWILSCDTKTVMLSTVSLQLVSNSTVLVSTIWWIPKNCTNTVLFSTVFMRLATDCTVFVLDLYCILYDDTKTILLSTVFLQFVSNSTVFLPTFYGMPKNCTKTVQFITVFIPVIRYPVLVSGTEWYRNDVQNGTVRYHSNTVYREYGTGTVPVSTVQRYWNSTVQYRNVYWDSQNHLITFHQGCYTDLQAVNRYICRWLTSEPDKLFQVCVTWAL